MGGYYAVDQFDLVNACIAGLDGAGGGWLAVCAHADGRSGLQSFAGFGEALQALERALVAIDMPIGLPVAARPGGRECDIAARRLLGRRAPCVFSPPPATV